MCPRDAFIQMSRTTRDVELREKTRGRRDVFLPETWEQSWPGFLWRKNHSRTVPRL